MIDYKTKYFKYKRKYLQYKNKIYYGGSRYNDVFDPHRAPPSQLPVEWNRAQLSQMPRDILKPPWANPSYTEEQVWIRDDNDTPLVIVPRGFSILPDKNEGDEVRSNRVGEKIRIFGHLVNPKSDPDAYYDGKIINADMYHCQVEFTTGLSETPHVEKMDVCQKHPNCLIMVDEKAVLGTQGQNLHIPHTKTPHQQMLTSDRAKWWVKTVPALAPAPAPAPTPAPTPAPDRGWLSSRRTTT